MRDAFSTMNHLDDATLNEYLDDVLDAPARAATQAHLDGCPACAARLESLRTLFTTLDALPEAPLARDLSAEVLRQLPRRAAPGLRPAWRWVFAAEALLALVLLAIAAPFASAWWPPTDVAELSQPLIGLVVSLVAGLAAEGQSTLSALIQLWNTGFSLAQAVTAPAQTSTGLVAGALALTAVLWLFGNGVLLRHVRAQSFPPHPRSRNG